MSVKHLAALFFACFAVAAEAETWHFALIGDTPYSDYERHELPRMLSAIADENVDFIIHAGDIKHSQDTCSDALFEDRREIFEASALPLVYVPGDNEWTDCARVSAGHYDPQERLARLRERFHSGDVSLGRTRIPLIRQAGEYREHQRWQHGPVLFVTLNVPGPNNNWLKTGQPGREALARTPRVLEWLHEGFAQARATGMKGIVITLQANPGFRHYRAGLGHSGYRELLDQLRSETLAFDGQVLLVHGDTHWQRIDQPLHDPETGKRITRFTRAETFGYPQLGWVKVIIDDESPALFRFEIHPWAHPRP